MGAIDKTALQFAFPVYLWLLAAIIVYFSKKSQIITRLVGKNAVKLLATIILYSYSKLICTIIDVYRVKYVLSNDRNETVWGINGERYFKNYHATLFAMATVITAITLPYSLALLFIQCLRKKSNWKILFWVNKLKPFFDAYTGPYKDSFHFWTGLLLILRIFMFIVFATNTTKGPVLNLTIIIGILSLLYFFGHPGIYRKKQLMVLEFFTYCNMIVLCLGTLYTLTKDYKNTTTIVICVGSMLALFCGIILYHMYKKISVTQWWLRFIRWLLNKKKQITKRIKRKKFVIKLHHESSSSEELSSSENELDPLLRDAPPIARYDQYREPLITMSENSIAEL